MKGGVARDMEKIKQRDVVVCFRVSPSERRRLEKTAKECGVTVSEYVRRAVQNAPLIPKVNQEAATNLRKIGGLLKMAIMKGYDEEKLNKILLILIKITKELQEEGDIR
jgi:hypothetical protein